MLPLGCRLKSSKQYNSFTGDFNMSDIKIIFHAEALRRKDFDSACHGVTSAKPGHSRAEPALSGAEWAGIYI
jgi:hypothetical protein